MHVVGEKFHTFGLRFNNKICSLKLCCRCIAERERLDKKERRQNMLEDAVQSSPSAKVNLADV